MALDITGLIDQVKANTDVEDSASLLLTQLSVLLASAIAALPDMTQLSQLQSDLKTHGDALAAAVVSNTPAAPPAPPAPVQKKKYP